MLHQSRFILPAAVMAVAGLGHLPAHAQCERAVLDPGDGAAGDLFAYTVSVRPGRACISANLDDDNGENSGSAYMFEPLPSGAWSVVAKLTPDDGAPGDEFSRDAVALDGNRLLIGALGDDDRGDRSGSAYVFERDENGVWVQTAKLLAGDGQREDFCGRAAGWNRPA